jgi:hypothetical protein
VRPKEKIPSLFVSMHVVIIVGGAAAAVAAMTMKGLIKLVFI